MKSHTDQTMLPAGPEVWQAVREADERVITSMMFGPDEDEQQWIDDQIALHPGVKISVSKSRVRGRLVVYLNRV